LPGQLTAASAATDLLLKEAMDALLADLQELYFQPLLEWIRSDVQTNNPASTGVDLVGTSSLIVRDRTLAENKGEAESFARFTPIPKFNYDLLTGAQTLSAGTGTQTQERVARDPKTGAVVTDHNGDPVKLTPSQTLDVGPDGSVTRMKNGDPVI